MKRFELKYPYRNLFSPSTKAMLEAEMTVEYSEPVLLPLHVRV